MTNTITLNLTLEELEIIDKYIELNDDTRQLFDKIQKAYPKSPAEEAYKEVYGWYPPTTPSVCNYEDNRWSAFQSGYNALQKSENEQQMKELIRESVKWCEEHPDKDPLDWLKPQTPEQTAQSLKEAFVKAQQTENWKETQKLIDEEDNDKNFKNSLDLIKEWGEKNKPQNLTDLIFDWWDDVFTTHSNWDMETSIEDLVDRIDKKFIPPSHDTNGYEWEKCLKIMREKLR